MSMKGRASQTPKGSRRVYSRLGGFLVCMNVKNGARPHATGSAGARPCRDTRRQDLVGSAAPSRHPVQCGPIATMCARTFAQTAS